MVLAAIIIWIIVLFRFTSFQGDNTDKYARNEVEKNIFPEKLIKEELNLNYRDPFSRNIQKQVDSNAELIKNSFRKIEVIWPDIIYSGFITNKKTGVISINLVVGNKSFIARKNQTIENVTIKKITENSVEIECNGAKKVFYLKK